MKNVKLLGHLITLLTVVIWGTTFVSTKVLLVDLEPHEILFYRFVIAYLALWLIYPKFKRSESLTDEVIFFCCGLSGITLYFLAENIALNYSLASNVGLLVSIAPLLTALLAHLSTKDEKLNKNLILGFIIAFTGVFLVIFNGQIKLKLSPIGDLLAVSAAIIWSVYSILLKKLGSKYNYIFVTRKIFFYGLITMIPFMFYYGINFNPKVLMQPKVIYNILFLSLVASSLCFVLWNTSVNLIGVVKASNYIYLVPLVTLITSVLVLNEVITQLAIFGGLLILSGVYISEHGFDLRPVCKFVKINGPKKSQVND